MIREDNRKYYSVINGKATRQESFYHCYKALVDYMDFYYNDEWEKIERNIELGVWDSEKSLDEMLDYQERMDSESLLIIEEDYILGSVRFLVNKVVRNIAGHYEIVEVQ